MQLSTENIIAILLTGTLFLVMLAGFILLLVKAFDNARKAFTLEKENISKEYETQILQTQLEIQEQTLEKISQEIHDNIGQALSFVKLSISTVDLQQPAATQIKLDESKDLITKTIQDLRNLSKILNTSFINHVGLITGIQYQLEYLQKTGVYETVFDFPDTTQGLPPDAEMVLFRIVQELLNNIVKHAGATKIQIGLVFTDDSLFITVRDNGKGFDKTLLADKPNLKGLGLSNMHKRLAPIQGNMSIESDGATGTCITIQVPLPSSPFQYA
ncbi:sensor histidine kinase [Paraflavitalea speifideaquila]|uniref:sensor histidine kinase n=1 Tax=Paraflavitalea speifideaquila TaxID=3076558 RepID=UPI0028E7E6BF|nr:sensor histidine kinase [Paraflavitalea speifideiaquila]